MSEDEENSETNDIKEPFAEGEEAGNYCDTWKYKWKLTASQGGALHQRIG
jgi:hypothetical protein